MQTSWRRHREYALATITFRVAALIGLATGVLVAMSRHVPGPAPCDFAYSSCATRIIRHEAVVHVLPPLAGLIAGMVVGTCMARALARSGLGARI